MIDTIIHKALCLLPPERAHAVAKWAMKKKLRAPGPFGGVWKDGEISSSHSGSTHLFDWVLASPLGLAAGFDKNGELVDVFQDYGFGFMEVGSVTLNGGPGNPKPRLFRIGEDGLLNRMGLNGDPAATVAKRLHAAKNPGPYGVNIAKTHSPEIMGDAAIRDIALCYEIMRSHGFYHVINISCPNTREGKTFEDPAALKELLAAIRDARYVKDKPWRDPSKRPLLVKLSPAATIDKGLRLSEFENLVFVCLDYGIDGFVCCNTIPHEHHRFGKGGLSGPECFQKALGVVRCIRGMNTGKTIIACGGIQTGYEMWEYNNAGASAFQSYAGFVRGPNAGPRFASKVLRQFSLRSSA